MFLSSDVHKAVKFKAFRGTFVLHVVCHSEHSLGGLEEVELVCEPFLHDTHRDAQRPEMVLSLTAAGRGVALIWPRASVIQRWSAN